MRRTPYVYDTGVLFFVLGGDMLESEYQKNLILKLERIFPNCRVMINDPNLPGQQGIPDLTIFIGDWWGLLEVKASEKSKLRPNQRWWVEKWSEHTFCSFIYPENEEEVIDAIQQALESRR